MNYQVRNYMHVLLTSLVAALLLMAVWAAPCRADLVDPETGEYSGSPYIPDEDEVEIDPQPVDPQPVDPQPVDPQPVNPQPVDPQPTDNGPTSQDGLPLVPLAAVALLAAVGATVAIVRLSGRDAHRQGLA